MATITSNTGMIHNVYSPTTTSIYPNTHLLPYNGPPPRRVRKPTAFEKGMMEAALTAVSLDHTDLFFNNDAQHLIDIFGKLKPIYNGRPQKWMHIILNACPADNAGMSKRGWNMLHTGFHAGLFYKVPLVPTKARTKFRVTMAGVRLLDHWAEKHPKFRPFLDAYLPVKARNQIAADCVDFMLGTEPARLKKLREKSAAEMAKIMIKQQSQVYSPALWNVAHQQQMIKAQQYYWTAQQQLANQGLPPNVLLNNPFTGGV